MTPFVFTSVRSPPFKKQSIDEYVSEKWRHHDAAAQASQHPPMFSTLGTMLWFQSPSQSIPTLNTPAEQLLCVFGGAGGGTFLSKMQPSVAALRARALCSSLLTKAFTMAGSRYRPPSNSRAANLARSTLLAARSRSLILTRPSRMPVSRMDDFAFSAPYGSMGHAGHAPPSVTAAPHPYIVVFRTSHRGPYDIPPRS